MVPQGDVPLEGEEGGLGQEVPELVQETGLPPADGGARLEVLRQFRVLPERLLGDVVDKQEDDLVRLAVGGVPQGDAHVGPLGLHVGLGEYDEYPGAGLCGHGDCVEDGGIGGEVPLVETQLVRRRTVLKRRRDRRVDKFGVPAMI